MGGGGFFGGGGGGAPAGSAQPADAAELPAFFGGAAPGGSLECELGGWDDDGALE